MSKTIVMGYWDCSYCDAVGIEGTKRDCPGCNRPRGEGVKFYMDRSNVQYLTSEEAESKGNGPDWLCSYCNSLNSALANECSSCGASKQEAEENYFTMNEDNSNSASDSDNKEKDTINGFVYHPTDSPNNNQSKDITGAMETSRNTEQNTSKHADKRGKISGVNLLKRIGVSLAAIFSVICLLMVIFPGTKEFTPTNFSWVYDIDIESYETVDESDWSLPDGARLQYKKDEIHHYDQVVDHYETKTRTYSEEVLDGYDISYEYTDNGDGTFSQHEVQTPRYRTEYREEQYEEPVYVDVPVYQTKYYYEIDKWIYKRSVTTKGNDKNPYWGEVLLEHNEREGKHNEQYSVSGKVKDKVKTYNCSKELWNQLNLGNSYKIKTSGDDIKEIK